jgi:hypothetical protein
VTDKGVLEFLSLMYVKIHKIYLPKIDPMRKHPIKVAHKSKFADNQTKI